MQESKKKNKRNISEATFKKLYLWSRNKCAFEECRNLILDENNANLGKVSHIVGLNETSARHDSAWSEKQLNDINNLILLCGECATKIDAKENESIYSKELLREMKQKHESDSEKIYSSLIANLNSPNWESNSPKMPASFESWADWKIESQDDKDFINKIFSVFIKKLELLPINVRKTLYLLIVKGFDFKIFNSKCKLINFLIGFKKTERDEVYSHLEVLKDHSWISIDNILFDENDFVKLSFNFDFRYDEYDTFFKCILAKINNNEAALEKVLVNLHFDL